MPRQLLGSPPLHVLSSVFLLAMVLLSKLDGFSLLHDPIHNWLYATWLGQRSSEVTRENYLLILQQVQQLRCTKLLNDSSDDKDGWSDLTLWLARDCFPELAESGIQAVAWVLPIDVQAFRDTQKVILLAKDPLIDVFRDVEAAHDWLLRWPK